MALSGAIGLEKLKQVAFKVLSKSEVAVKEGRAFTQSRYYSGLSNGSTTSILIRNYTSTDLEATNIFIASTGHGLFEMRKNVTVTNAGTDMTPRNRRTGSPDNSGVELSWGATHTGGKSMGMDVIPGSSPFNITGQTPSSNYIVSSGDNLAVLLTNKSGSSNDFSIRVTYERIK